MIVTEYTEHGSFADHITPDGHDKRLLLTNDSLVANIILGIVMGMRYFIRKVQFIAI
jgi:hypothetical protein